MMARRKRLGFYWIREREGHRWEPAELVNHRGYLEVMVIGFDMGIPIDEIYEWGGEIQVPFEEHVELEKDCTPRGKKNVAGEVDYKEMLGKFKRQVERVFPEGQGE